MRQDEMEDMVGMVNQVFLGMTTNCAHAMTTNSSNRHMIITNGIRVAGVEFGERKIKPDKQSLVKAEKLKAQIEELNRSLNEIEQAARMSALKHKKTNAKKIAVPQLSLHGTSSPDWTIRLAPWTRVFKATQRRTPVDSFWTERPDSPVPNLSQSS